MGIPEEALTTDDEMTRSAPGSEDLYVFPASSSQQRFWMLDQLDPGNPAYNVAVRFRLEGPLHAPTLERAVNEIVRRHEILRTTFVAENGEPMQVIAPTGIIHVSNIDLRYLAESERHGEAERLGLVEARAPFDLKRWPLMRVSLLRLKDDEHMLLVTIHHAVSDGWSIGVFTDELGAIYEAFAQGSSSPLPDLPIQYADYTVWQNERLTSAEMRANLDYWTKTLQGAVELNLLTDRPRAGMQTFNGSIVSTLLPKTLTAALQELSVREEVTLFTVMLAGFNILFHHYTGQEDILVGSPIAGRDRVEIEPLIGVFINTLALRNDLSGDPTFRELLERTRQTVAGALEHQDLPFEKLVEGLRPPRDAGRNPLFQVNFTYQRDFIKPLAFAGVRLTAIPSISPGSIFDLTFFLVERAEGWRASCEYNSDLFKSGTVQRMLEHFTRLLQQIAKTPERRISEFSLLSDAEHRQLVVDWNATSTAYPRDKTIAEVFAARARQSPDACAVEFGEQSLTYHQLDEAANRLGHFLQRQGIGPDVPVGVLMDRSAARIVALLGILKAGGAYLPIDAASPASRVAFILQEARVPLTLTFRGLAPALPAGATAVELDDWRAKFSSESPAQPVSRATAESLAYVMFTSGSTGRPKGVAIPQRAVTRLVLNTNYIVFTADDVVAQASNIAFDAATLEIWGALLNGARLTGVSTAMAPHDFARQLRERGVTTLFLTTALFNQVVRAEPRVFAPLHNVVFGGEAADPGALREIFKHGAPPKRLVNGYGPTESTTFAVCHHVTEVSETALSIPIGRPIANTEIYLLNEHQQPVPIGVPGEIHIGGDGLAVGYLNRPDLDAERFVYISLNDKVHRLYRTGDLARYLPDGTIDFLGRIDQQVKIRGFRVEIGEIEAVLNRHPAVRERVVIARDDVAGKQLVAYVVLHPGLAVSAAELRDFLKKDLPDYMVPSAIAFLEALPVTANGKLDLRALPEPDFGLREKGQIAPRTKAERELVALSEKLLRRSPIGVNDNFFEIGGHSLLALSMFAQIEARFGRNLPLASLFKAPTIGALAKMLDGASDAPASSTVVAVQPNGSKPPLFCVHGGDGGVLFYHSLGARFDHGRPLHALEAPWLHGQAQAHETIEQIAADYVREIRAVHPHGPYHLGGFSFGGVVVFEMAQQLLAQGQTVGSLVLFDTYNPLSPPRRLTLPERVRFNFLITARMPWSKKFGHFLARAREKYLIKKRVREELVDQSQALELMAAGQAIPTELRYLLAREAHVRAMRSYAPKPYPGSMLLFVAQDRFEGYQLSSTLGWEEFVGRLQICSVPGSHDTILKEPSVQVLAKHLETALAEEDERTSVSAAAGRP